MGCCLIDNRAGFYTEKMCSNLADIQGKEYEFLSGILELSCLSIPQFGEDGACVSPDGSCQRTTDDKCDNTFYKGYLCSAEEVGSNCERQASVGLEEDFYEIYWFDSCGNRENIYSSNKDASWANGKILSKEESCGADSKNGNSASTSCGNCNRNAGSVGVETTGIEKHIAGGNFVCRNIDCPNAPLNGGRTGLKKHQETWCLYDGALGNGIDPVGSEHWVASCINGKVEVDKCGEARSEICEEGEIYQQSTGEGRALARCVVNQAQLCKAYNENLQNDPAGVQETCEANSHCEFRYLNVDSGFKFGICLPKYPQGFDLRPFDDAIYGDETPDFASMTCSVASMSCTIIKKRKTSTESDFGMETFWSDQLNSDCREIEFVDQMNNFCVSLGDCGSYTNYIGKTTDNLRVQGVKEEVYKKSWAEHFGYSANAKAVEGQHVDSQNLENLEAFMAGTSEINAPGTGDDYHIKRAYESWLTIASGVSGGLGFTWLKYGSPYFFPADPKAITSAGGLPEAGVGAVLGASAYALIGASIGATVSSTMASTYNIEGKEASGMVFSGATGGAAAGFLIYFGIVAEGAGWSLILATLGPMGAGIAIALVAIAIIVNSYMASMRIGEVGKDTVNFYCYPWEAPRGGDDCHVCNEDPLKPCTRYRCESLGQLCQIVNEGGDENPPCISVPLETNVPEVVDYRILTNGYKLTQVEGNKFKLRTNRDNCIPEYEQVDFVIETDEYSQCSWDWKRPEDYLSTQANSADEGRYRLNHIFSVEEFPSVASLDPQYIEGNIDTGYVGEQIMYITCSDFNGNPTFEPIMVDVCIDSEANPTPAYIKAFTHPEGYRLKFGETKLENWGLWLNRPAECKWDKIAEKKYEDMANEMRCELDPLNGNDGINGYPCDGTLTDLTAGKNNIFIKCKNLQDNINTNDFEYSVFVTENNLEITSLEPAGYFEEASQPVEFELKVSTSKGANDGKSKCEFFNNGQWIVFKETSSTSHRQFLNFWAGSHSMKVRCTDDAGNVAEGNIDFELKVDDVAPKIVEFYYEAGKIIFFTNEESRCAYELDTCNFEVASGQDAYSNNGIKHEIIWSPGETHYIKCRDLKDNENVGCAQKIAVLD